MAFPRFVRSVVTVLALTLGTAATVQGWCTEHRTMYLTFNAPIQLPGVSLARGTYVFELADPRTDPAVVRVLSRDRSTVYLTALTRMVRRPADRFAPISFGEAPPGHPTPIRTWYPSGDSNGRQFIYAERDNRVASARGG